MCFIKYFSYFYVYLKAGKNIVSSNINNSEFTTFRNYQLFRVLKYFNLSIMLDKFNPQIIRDK